MRKCTCVDEYISAEKNNKWYETCNDIITVTNSLRSHPTNMIIK